MKDLKIQRGYTRNTAYVEYENEVITVIIRARGTILKWFRKYLKNVNGKNDITVLQKVLVVAKVVIVVVVVVIVLVR